MDLVETYLRRQYGHFKNCDEADGAVHLKTVQICKSHGVTSVASKDHCDAEPDKSFQLTY